MTEVTKDLIFRIGFESKDQTAQALEAQLASVTDQYKKAKAGSLEFVEAEKKVATASAAAGQQFERTAKTTSQFESNLNKARATMAGLTAIDKVASTVGASLTDLSEGAAGVGREMKTSAAEIDKINGLVEKFKESLSGATKLSQVDQITTEFKKLSDGLSQEGVSIFIDKITESSQEAQQALVDLTKQEFIAPKTQGIVEKAVKEVDSLQKQLRALRIEAQNSEDPEAIMRLTEEAGKLQDKITSTNEVIKALSSSTFFTDTIVEGATTAVSAFTTLQGILTLVGSDNEELAESAQKAQGALALLAGSQQLLTDLKKGDNIITRAQIVAQRAYAAVVGQTTGALKVARLALSALGVGAVVTGIILLVQNWQKLSQVLGISNPQRERANAISKKAVETAGEEIAAIRVASEELKSNNTTQERRTAIIEDLKEKYPSYLANIDAEKSSYIEIEAALQKVNKALLAKASLNAAQELLSDKIKEKLNLENTALKENLSLFDQALAQISGPAAGAQFAIEKGFLNKSEGLKTIDDEINAILQDVLDFQNQLDTLGGDPTAPAVEAERAAARKIAETKAKIGTIAELEAKVAELRKRARENAVIGTDEFFEVIDLLSFAEKKLAEAQALLTDQVDNGPEEGSIAALEERVANLRTILNETSQSAEDYTDILEQMFEAEDILNNAKKLIERQDLFTPRANELTEAERHEVAMAQIKKAGEERIIEIQIDYRKRRLELLKQFGKLTIEEETKINNEIAELEAQKAQIKKDADQEEIDSNAARVRAIIDGTTQVIQAAISTAQTLLAIEQEKNDRLIQLQQDRVQDVLNIADQGNAEMLQMEEKRLDDLNKKREKFVRQQQALAAIQLIAETAIAIAKAAAEGGAAAPFTIAATLLALTAGLAQARQMASQAAFYTGGPADWDALTGGYTGNGNPRDVSVSAGRKPYTYHKQEYIMDHSVTGFRNNRKWFDHIRQYRVDLDDVFNRRPETVVVPIGGDNRELIEAIREIPGPSFHLNSKGIISIVEKNRSAKNRVSKIRRLR